MPVGQFIFNEFTGLQPVTLLENELIRKCFRGFFITPPSGYFLSFVIFSSVDDLKI